jgi:F5/8 type C domain-containing protein
MRATLRRVLAISPIVILIACTSGAPSVGPPSPSAPVASESTRASASPSAIAASPGASTSARCEQLTRTSDFDTASRAAMDELMLAIGNPDVNSPSEASAAFDEALTAGDDAEIVATAETVLAHLSRSRGALSAYEACRSSVVGLAEWEGLIAGLEAGVTAMRDAGVAGSSADVEAARVRYSNALQDHFWQAVHGKATEEASMRWPDGRTIRASRARFGLPVTNAFDGKADSIWSAGDEPAPQWIEVDFGRPVSITGIRLLAAQDASGTTDQEVTVRTPTGEATPFARLTGPTADQQWLAYEAPDTVSNVQVVRVTTLASGSSIGWREIEVQLAPESVPRACAAGTTNLALGRPVTASTSLSGSPSSFAVDGKTETAWKAGGQAPQRIEVDLGADVAVSEVRLLVAQATGETGTVNVVNARDTAGNMLNLGFLSGTSQVGQWLSLPGPRPCVGLRWISVETGASDVPVAWSEIQVLGSPTP